MFKQNMVSIQWMLISIRKLRFSYLLMMILIASSRSSNSGIDQQRVTPMTGTTLTVITSGENNTYSKLQSQKRKETCTSTLNRTTLIRFKRHVTGLILRAW